jgi:geranylgeranyl pyrophosphate synthase/predicted secreted hydrolase
MDWPGDGPIDLAVHDLPHASSTTEWWYTNAHVRTADGRDISVFASFFRIAAGKDEATGEIQYAHSLTWALTDVGAKKYYPESLVDRRSPELGLKRMEQGEGSPDPRLRQALREILERGRVPYPDRMFQADPYLGHRKLELDFDGHRFSKADDGSYRLELYHEYFKVGCNLTLRPLRKPMTHGDRGVVKGIDGSDMFYYLIPRCEVTGEVTLNAIRQPIAEGGLGWYDHEFGGHKDATEGESAVQEVGWNWCALQFAEGGELSIYALFDLAKGESVGRFGRLVSPEGKVTPFEEVEFEPVNRWRSTRSFNDYPTRFRVRVPELEVALELGAVFDDQEFITLISKPAFWEGRVEARGTIGGRPVEGKGYVERSGFTENKTLDQFFDAVSETVRDSVAKHVPLDPSFEQMRDMVASEGREYYLKGVDRAQYVDTGIKPIREITNRGGKGWRSYAALACCEVVGGDSREFVQWLAMPELMHVGSLIVDDVQDKSNWRRGGPACHQIYGEAIAINAGTACYFMGQKLLVGGDISDAAKLRLYDFYFAALRAGHAGQAIDIDGLDRFMDPAVESGDAKALEQRVLAIHLLKTAAPAGSLSRMGALVGGGSEEQIEALGKYFEHVGMAFQIVDDVLNLRGFERELKARGEDITHGKVTFPIARAISLLGLEDRRWLWQTVQSKPRDAETVAKVIELLESCGALSQCETEAERLVEAGWARLQPLIEDSVVSLMLRSFGWYVIQRHY